MSKFTIKAVLALLEIILALLAKVIRLVDTIRDLLDDKEINGSVTYCSENLDAFQTLIIDWVDTLNNDVESIRHDLD